MITVNEAIEILKAADPEAIILISSDDEGNSHRHANFSLGETGINQDGTIDVCVDEDISAGEYEGWEDDMFPAIVIW